MTNLLKGLRNTAFGLSLLIGTAHVARAADASADGKVQEEMTKFAEECEKLREDHVQEMRALHVKHINEMYDKKLANIKDMGVLWRQIKPGDKEGNKAIRKQIKERQKAFHDEIEKFRDDFKDNVLKAKHKAFQASMNERIKEMQKKHKD